MKGFAYGLFDPVSNGVKLSCTCSYRFPLIYLCEGLGGVAEGLVAESSLNPLQSKKHPGFASEIEPFGAGNINLHSLNELQYRLPDILVACERRY